MEAREGTEKEKPCPERMEWVRLRTRDSIADWTEESGRSVTSRHASERERSARVKGLAAAAEEVEGLCSSASALRVWSMTASGLSLDLNGRESDSGSAARRRFFCSAIVRDFLVLQGGGK